MEQKVRAALYARVSTQEQVDGYSLDAQERAFRSLAESRGWDVYQVYREEGQSAHVDDVNKRPVFKEAIDDALSGKYDVLVVHKIDRFSRRRRITDEYFEKLHKAGVGFFSISEQMDFSTPMGSFALGMFGGMAQLYSENLGEETKKGLAERRAQGLYCGSLPFGVIKGEDRSPSSSSRHSPWPRHGFSGSSQGEKQPAGGPNHERPRLPHRGHPWRWPVYQRHSERNSPQQVLHRRDTRRKGWSETCQAQSHHRPLSFQSSAGGKGQETPGTITHEEERHNLQPVRADKCVQCEGPMWVHRDNTGRPRIFCGSRKQGLKCQGKATYLSVYEDQLLRYMQQFVIPDDYQERILALYSSLSAQRQEAQVTKVRLMGRLDRLKKLYQWDDISEAEYLAESREIKQQLEGIVEPEEDEEVLDRLRAFLTDIGLDWERATQEQRNRLAHQLFETIWVRDRQVVSVRPRAELRAFSQLSEECQGESLSWGSDKS